LSFKGANLTLPTIQFGRELNYVWQLNKSVNNSSEKGLKLLSISLELQLEYINQYLEYSALDDYS